MSEHFKSGNSTEDIQVSRRGFFDPKNWGLNLAYNQKVDVENPQQAPVAEMSTSLNSHKFVFERHELGVPVENFINAPVFREGLVVYNEEFDVRIFDRMLLKNKPKMREWLVKNQQPCIFMDVWVKGGLAVGEMIAKDFGFNFVRSGVGIYFIGKYILKVVESKSLFSRRNLLKKMLKSLSLLAVSGSPVLNFAGSTEISLQPEKAANSNIFYEMATNDPSNFLFTRTFRDAVWAAKIGSPEFVEYREKNISVGAAHVGIKDDLAAALGNRQEYLKYLALLWKLVRMTSILGSIEEESLYTSVKIIYDKEGNHIEIKIVHEDIKDAILGT